MNPLERRLARLFTVGISGHELDADAKRLLALGVSGVVLFSRNVAEPKQVFELTRAVRKAAKEPVWVSIDQEGGRVARLRNGFTRIPAMRRVGDINDAALTEALGELIAKELRAVGVDLNFAPVMDVDTNPDNPVIGDRSFGREPDRVRALGRSLISGMQKAGVAACAKHFPGHGDTDLDSHSALPRLTHSMERLEQVELVPFRAAVEQGVASIMTAHVIFDAVDPGVVATMSRPVLEGLLREKLGFDGVVFSDDVEMAAIARHFGVERAAVDGLNAGVDNFLVCHTAATTDGMIAALAKAIESGQVSEARVEQAERRVSKLLSSYSRRIPARFDDRVLNCAEHQAVVARFSDQHLGDTRDDPTERCDSL